MTEAIVLAGGLGTRLRSLVSDVPKPMAPINGRPFLEHLMEYWVNQGVEHFVLAVGYKHELVQAQFGNYFMGVPVSYSIEEKLLGTGGGIVKAAKLLTKEAPFLVVNGDTFFDIELDSFSGFHKEKNAMISLVLTRLKKNTRYGGVELDQDHMITGFEAEDQVQAVVINAGIYLIDQCFLSQDLEQGVTFSIEKDLFPELARDGNLAGYVQSGTFIDIGVPADYQRCGKLLSARSSSGS